MALELDTFQLTRALPPTEEQFPVGTAGAKRRGYDPRESIALLPSVTGSFCEASKARLFACACFRSNCNLLPADRGRRDVEDIERRAGGLASRSELHTALADAKAVQPASTGPAGGGAGRRHRLVHGRTSLLGGTSLTRPGTGVLAPGGPAPRPYRPVPVELTFLGRNGGRVA